MINKNKIVMFIGSTIFFVAFMVTCNHNFSTKGRPPQTWEQIWNDKWFYLGGCICSGLLFTLKFGGKKDNQEEVGYENDLK